MFIKSIYPFAERYNVLICDQFTILKTGIVVVQRYPSLSNFAKNTNSTRLSVWLYLIDLIVIKRS